MLELALKFKDSEQLKWFEVSPSTIENILKTCKEEHCTCIWGWRSDIKRFEHSFWFGDIFGMGDDKELLESYYELYLHLKELPVEELEMLDAYLETFGYELFYSVDNYKNWWEQEGKYF